jgi:hypothetical protein
MGSTSSTKAEDSKVIRVSIQYVGPDENPVCFTDLKDVLEKEFGDKISVVGVQDRYFSGGFQISIAGGGTGELVYEQTTRMMKTCSTTEERAAVIQKIKDFSLTMNK